jgi:class 3 adenylate cyclase
MGEAEMLASQSAFVRNVLAIACGLTLLVTLLALAQTRSFLGPVNALLDGIDRLRRGDRDARIPVGGRDELGHLVTQVNAMGDDLRAQRATITANREAYAVLLRQLFPEFVADRMVKGDGDVDQTYPQVCVVYARVLGLSVVDPARLEAVGALRSELVDELDAAAVRLGIERVFAADDRYFAVAGMDTSRLDHVRHAVELAEAAGRAVATAAERHDVKLHLRVGIALGAARAGFVGTHRFSYDVWGPTVATARALMESGRPDVCRLTRAAAEHLGEDAQRGGVVSVDVPGLGPVDAVELSLGASEVRELARSPARPGSAGEGAHV